MVGVCSWWCDFFFCKQKTAYELRISDWSSDVCSSDLSHVELARLRPQPVRVHHPRRRHDVRVVVAIVAIVVRGMDRRIDRHPVTVADILCESTNQVAALAGVQLGRQSPLILPPYLGVLTLLRCLRRVPPRPPGLTPLPPFPPHRKHIRSG